MVEINDIVHVLAEPDKADGIYRITNSSGYLIVNPQMILSGTSILSSLGCLRKSTLNWRFKESSLSTSASTFHLELGNLLHMLFQSSIQNKIYEQQELKAMLIEMLKRKEVINSLYQAKVDEELILKEASVYLASIEQWLKENVKMPAGYKTGTKNLQVMDVFDIEESIWSPKYGIKGKLDLTLQIDLKQAAFKSLNAPSSNTAQTQVIPVELKSGKTTFSIEHEGQVMLYSLLNNESRARADFGLLLYLKDMKMKFIKVSKQSLNGLLQLRNELVYYISKNKLPALKNDERWCSKCSLLTVCSLFNEKDKEKNTIASAAIETESELYSKSLSHLSIQYKAYFFQWYKMLELEFGEHKQFDSGEIVWWKSTRKLESEGWTVCGLKLCKSNEPINQTQSSEDSFYLFEFKKVDR